MARDESIARLAASRPKKLPPLAETHFKRRATAVPN